MLKPAHARCTGKSILTITAACLIVAACNVSWAQPRQDVPVARDMREYPALTAWLECDECEAGELKAVVRLGEAALPTLGTKLRQGIAPAAVTRLRPLLEQRYDELAEHAQANPQIRLGSPSKNAFVELQMQRWQTQLQMRATRAIAAIGGASSRKILEAALATTDRPDLRSTIQQALKTLR
jgi:hypothetical protein